MAARGVGVHGLARSPGFCPGVCTSITAGYLACLSAYAPTSKPLIWRKTLSPALSAWRYMAVVVKGLLVTGLSCLGADRAVPDLQRSAGVGRLCGWAVRLQPCSGRSGGGIFTNLPTWEQIWWVRSKKRSLKMTRATRLVIADLVGDNVGDCAGRAPISSRPSAMTSSPAVWSAPPWFRSTAAGVIYLPILLQCVGIYLLPSLVFWRPGSVTDQNPQHLNVGLWISAVLSSGGAMALSYC